MNEVLVRILANVVNGIGRFFEWLILLIRLPFEGLWHFLRWVVLSFMALRFWPKMGVLGSIVGIAVFIYFYSTLGWAKNVAAWFRSSQGTEATTFTILAILGLIYWKFPSLFAPLLTTCFFGILLVFMFELNRSKLERQGQNHWAVFFIFILPLLPVLFTFLEYANKLTHIVSASTYIALIVALMVTNPNKVFEPRLFSQGTIYIIALLLLLLIVVIGFNKDVLSEDWSAYLSRIGMLFVTCAALALAVSLAIKFFTTNPTWSVRYLIMLLILIVAGAIVVSAIWKRLPNKSYFSYFSKANLALKYLMLLSCWCSDVVATIVSEPMQTWALLLIEIALIVWYIMSKQVFTKLREGGAGGLFKPTGTMVRNDPLNLRYETVLPISQNFKYNYAVSCWVYLNAQPPNASPEATGFANIVSYGGRPAVSFNASTNVLRITMRTPGGKKKGLVDAVKTIAEFKGESMPSEELHTTGPMDVLVADIPDVALQKWIHFVFYYSNSGMLDIFINGVLYKSVSAIVTDESSGLTIGARKGNTGKIANVMFFQGHKNPENALFVGGDAIDASTVKTLYNDFKHRDPPVVKRMFPVDSTVFNEASEDVSTTATNVSQNVKASSTATQGAFQTAFDPNRVLERQF